MAKININRFRKIVWGYYKKHKRSMPWRDDLSPYSIFISEVMLQQTQVSRVITKYIEFKTTFPDFISLAKANTKQLLRVWQGMGYNRRALYLRSAAQVIEQKYNGAFPSDVHLLDELPGIGLATASSIAAFAFNIPVVFIETNIRRVFIHHFFSSSDKVHDNEILPLIKQALDKKNAREWYWALMDYGAHLGTTIPNPNKNSRHYTKQARFTGSVRQVRGHILRMLLEKPHTLSELKLLYPDDPRCERAINGLVKEELIHQDGDMFSVF